MAGFPQLPAQLNFNYGGINSFPQPGISDVSTMAVNSFGYIDPVGPASQDIFVPPNTDQSKVQSASENVELPKAQGNKGTGGRRRKKKRKHLTESRGDRKGELFNEENPDEILQEGGDDMALNIGCDSNSSGVQKSLHNLLDEILSQKKMELLQSVDMVEFLTKHCEK